MRSISAKDALGRTRPIKGSTSASVLLGCNAWPPIRARATRYMAIVSMPTVRLSNKSTKCTCLLDLLDAMRRTISVVRGFERRAYKLSGYPDALFEDGDAGREMNTME